jgi:hypothetical protein
MCSQKRNRRWMGRGWLAGVAALGLLMPGCAPDYVTGSTAPVNFYVAAVTNSEGGMVIESDIRDGTGENQTVLPDHALVSVAVRNKNPGRENQWDVAGAVIVDSYTVRYYRTDGRGVEGVDVPYRITGNLTLVVDVENSGTTEVQIEVVRRQAKNEPPLSMIQQTMMLTAFAEVTLYGATIAGERVSASGAIQIDFADYAESTTTTPPSS